MDKIQKILNKLTKKENEAMTMIMFQILEDYTKIPGLKKLKNFRDHYRVRVGSYRVIFQVLENGKAEIRRVTKRDDQTYKNL